MREEKKPAQQEAKLLVEAAENAKEGKGSTK